MGSLLGCSLVALLLAGTGLGARPVETTIQDDALLLHRTDRQVRQAARQMAELGADRVRITAGWSVIAPSPRSRRKPGAPFDPEDPRTYPEEGFARLDRAIRAIDEAGLQAQIDIAFWAPRWAVRSGSTNPERHRHRPDPAAFADFAEAVARRYSGSFREDGQKLPAVRMYTTWNEPNHASFLAPQWKRTADGLWRPYSPHVYRAMHQRAYWAIKRVSRANEVLVGGLSSFGSFEPGSGHVPPLEFLRTMACVDRFMRPLRVPECRDFRRLRADGFALHPYSVHGTPAASSPNPDDAPLADIDRVAETIDALHAAGRTDRRWDLYLTEYGYETSPPDPYARYTPRDQARFHGWATFLAQRNPRTRMFAQFLLRDIDAADSGYPRGSRRRWRDWQSGLLYADGRPKPAAQAFKIPLFAQYAVGADGQPALLLYGGVRPGASRRVVRVERLDPGTGQWLPVDTTGTDCDRQTNEFLTDGDGFFTRTAPWHGPATYRLAWRRADRYEYGAEVPVDADPPLLAPPTG